MGLREGENEPCWSMAHFLQCEPDDPAEKCEPDDPRWTWTQGGQAEVGGFSVLCLPLIFDTPSGTNARKPSKKEPISGEVGK